MGGRHPSYDQKHRLPFNLDGGTAMNKQIILNVPVKDLDKSKAFFSTRRPT